MLFPFWDTLPRIFAHHFIQVAAQLCLLREASPDRFV